MELQFNVTKENRKAMVKAIEDQLGVKAKYLGAPGFVYEIGRYSVDKNGTLSWDEPENKTPDYISESADVVNACITATGNTPAEWENNTEEPEEENIDLTVTLPLNTVQIGNLQSLLEAKGELIKKALGIESLSFTTTGETISFPWFKNITPQEAQSYTRFVTALCDMSRNQKRVTAKPKENENEKYAFRCFLLRLGFIGSAHKEDRKILLRNLSGSASFPTKAAADEFSAKQKAKREEAKAQ